MVLMEWSEDYSVGHKEIDEQHKELIRIINNLHESLIGDDDRGLVQITGDALSAVIRYSEKHFEFEEKLLEEAGYEKLVYHRKLHADFYGRICGLYDRRLDGEVVLNSQLMKTLRNWLIEHILSEDKKYVAKLSSHFTSVKVPTADC